MFPWQHDPKTENKGVHVWIWKLHVNKQVISVFWNRLTNLESILASNLAFLIKLTIHLSASSGVIFNFSASMLFRKESNFLINSLKCGTEGVHTLKGTTVHVWRQVFSLKCFLCTCIYLLCHKVTPLKSPACTNELRKNHFLLQSPIKHEIKEKSDKKEMKGLVYPAWYHNVQTKQELHWNGQKANRHSQHSWKFCTTLRRCK